MPGLKFLLEADKYLASHFSKYLLSAASMAASMSLKAEHTFLMDSMDMMGHSNLMVSIRSMVLLWLEAQTLVFTLPHLS